MVDFDVYHRLYANSPMYKIDHVSETKSHKNKTLELNTCLNIFFFKNGQIYTKDGGFFPAKDMLPNGATLGP